VAMEKRIPTSVALAPSVLRDLRDLAERENRSMSRMMEVAIQSYAATHRTEI
jgi:predicted transcriptional regulator